MKPRIKTFDNGLRIVSERMPDIASVAVGVWIGAGARAERANEHGIAHVLEHMAFKGTRKRTAREIAEAIENVGGDMNAATSLEHTVYYTRLLGEDLNLALEILADILTESTFEPTELEREKAVIVQEISAIQDSPEDLIFDLLQEAAFNGSPLGHPIAGTIASVEGFAREDIIAFMKRHYHAPHCVISAAGGVDHEAFAERVEKCFAKLPNGSPPALMEAEFKGEERMLARPMEQAQLALAFPGVRYGHDDVYTAHVFAGLLGGGMSSRLFQEVREKRGLCYAISAFHWPYIDTGLFGLHAATAPSQVNELMPVMIDVLRAAATHVEEKEIARTKAQFKAGLLMGLESTSTRAEHCARQLLTFDRIKPLEEIVASIEAVSVEKVRSFASAMLNKHKSAFAAIGPQQALPTEAKLAAYGLKL